MTTEKKYLIVAGAVIVVTGVIVAVAVAFSLKSPTSAPVTPEYVPAQQTPPEDAQTITTQQGSVTVFSPSQSAVSSDTSVPQTPTDLIANTPDYNITYQAADSSFLVVLGSLPLTNARVLAETALLKSLNITNADACKLNVSLKVPYSLDPADAATDFHLSFCGNGVPITQ